MLCLWNSENGNTAQNGNNNNGIEDEEGREEVVPEGLKGGGWSFVPIMRLFSSPITVTIISHFINDEVILSFLS